MGKLTHADSYKRFNGKALGNRIRSERKRMKLSLQALGEAAGFTKSHIWEMEQGNCNNPSMAAMLGLSETLNVSIEHLLFGEDAGKWGPFRSKFERLDERDQQLVLSLMDNMLKGKTQ